MAAKAALFQIITYRIIVVKKKDNNHNLKDKINQTYISPCWIVLLHQQLL